MIHPLVGRVAPDLTLPNQHGAQVTLSALRGSTVLLVFLPFAFSELCTAELLELRDSAELHERPDLRVLCVTCDSMFAQREWADRNGYADDILSDFWPHGDAAIDYGVFNLGRGLAVRASFIIGPDGVVRWALVNGPGMARPVDAYVEALQSLENQ